MSEILVINPGSTSTKIAWYRDKQPLWKESIEHSAAQLAQYPTVFDQLSMRTQLILDAMTRRGAKPADLSAVMARGGLLPPLASGAYEVNAEMLYTLRHHAVNEHASNLGAAIAQRIAEAGGVRAYIYDPVTVDEMSDLVRITGLADIRRHGQGHNLNMRAAALRWCEENKTSYRCSTLIAAHLGGGITLSLHHNGRIEDMISDDEGAFSPERAGEIPSYKLLKKIGDEHLDYAAAMKCLQRNGGLMSHFGTADTRVIEQRALGGDAHAKLVYDAMALSVARCVAKLAVVVDGHVDAIILTGGIAWSQYFTGEIARRVRFIAPVSIIPGENEMEALAKGALRVLRGEEQARVYHGPCKAEFEAAQREET